jgi:uncharacterized repeat protein (TIGR03803 family)
MIAKNVPFFACLALSLSGCLSGGPFAATPDAEGARGAAPLEAASGSSGLRVLYSFQNGTDGAVPAASLTADKSGNLYGTTTNVGGVGSCNVHCGNVFELSPPKSKGSRWTFTILYDFKGGRDGGLPQGGVTLGADGSLYGTANVGGAYGKFGWGVLFRLKRAGNHWTEKVLHDFGRGHDGQNPHGNLLADGKGNLFGTTANGGKFFAGTVYELSSSGNSETVVYNFSGGEDGGTPVAGLAIDRASHLYGTTVYGGYFSYFCQAGCGTVFEVSPPSASGDPWKYAVAHQFTAGVPGDGALPFGPVMVDQKGDLFGTTFAGQGSGGGTAFELTPIRHKQIWAETVLYRFPAYRGDAANSQAGFIADSAGNLYATSQNGGAKFKGDVFKLLPPATSSGAWTDAILSTFSGARHGPTYPATSLVVDAQGRLYGTTPYGGTGSCRFTKIHGCGAIFEVSP